MVEADLEIGRSLHPHEADVVDGRRKRGGIQHHDRHPGGDCGDATGAGAEGSVDEVKADLLAFPHDEGFGALLQKLGFAAVARHRSREVLLYRQGGMNLMVNAHLPKCSSLALSAVALRVHDAAFAHQHSLNLGAWDQPRRAAAMELNIPGIHGAGDSLMYFVDRYQDFSIYDVDFVPLPGTEPSPPALAGLIGSATHRPGSWYGRKVGEMVRRVDETGYRGDYSFEVFNDDYRTLPLPMVAERARRSVKWLTDQVSRRSLPPRRLAPRD